MLAVVVVGDGLYDIAPVGGVPMVVRAVRALLATRVVDNVTVRTCAHRCAYVATLVVGLPVTVSDDAGGRSSADIVVVHEAARALAPSVLVSGVVGAVRAGSPAAVPVIPLTDTVKQVHADGAMRGAADRATLRVVQSPFAFRGGLLPDLPEGPLDLVRMCSVRGEAVHTVPGDPLAVALRTPWDVERAELLLVHEAAW